MANMKSRRLYCPKVNTFGIKITKGMTLVNYVVVNVTK